MNVHESIEEVSEKGWCVVRSCSETEVEDFVSKLGKLINKSDIKAKQGSDQFIHGTNYIEFHTDDPRAKYVLWQCVETADVGGENILKDMSAVFESISPTLQASLQKVSFIVNLPGAPIEADYVSFEADVPKFYYAPWKKGSNENAERAESIFFLSLALLQQDEIVVSLEKGDVLLIDNKRMVHGRKPFRGAQRHLRRYLVS